MVPKEMQHTQISVTLSCEKKNWGGRTGTSTVLIEARTSKPATGEGSQLSLAPAAKTPPTHFSTMPHLVKKTNHLTIKLGYCVTFLCRKDMSSLSMQSSEGSFSSVNLKLVNPLIPLMALWIGVKFCQRKQYCWSTTESRLTEEKKTKLYARDAFKEGNNKWSLKRQHENPCCLGGITARRT